MRTLARLGVAALVVALAGANAAWASDSATVHAAASRKAATILVRFTDAAAAETALAARGDHAAGRVGKHVWIVHLRPGTSIDSSLLWYRARPRVVYAEPDYHANIDLSAPDDPSYGAEWGLTAIDAVAGWSTYPGSYPNTGGVPIAVIDTGVYAGHPDLGAKIETALGANCVSGTCNGAGSSVDDNGHGTHVSGIAAALTNNGAGIAGVAVSSPVIPVKALDSSGSGGYDGVANGISWAVAHGARVVNMSLGGTGFSQTLCDAVSSALSDGVLIVAAAGNSGTSQATYPAACPGAVGVSATSSSGGYPSFSNYGSPDVFVSAPGVSIYSTMWPGTSGGCGGLLYCSLQGTSMASPFVAGLAALLFGERTSLTPSAAKVLLAQTAHKIGPAGTTYGPDPYGTCVGCSWNTHYGYGQIDVQAALAEEPAQIASFSPQVAEEGTSVAITGSGLAGATAVSFGLVPASFTVDSSTQVTASIPAGVAYGRWRVTTPNGTAVSALVGSVPLPTITGVSAGYGGSGSTVTIRGSGFTGVSDVTLGFVPVTSFSVSSPTAIVATIPSGVAYGRFRVKTPLGTAVAATVFTVFSGSPGGLTFDPPDGPTGAAATLAAPDLSGVTAVSLGFVDAAYTVGSPISITATVPAGVAYGRWRVETPSGTLVSDLIFSVPAPVITGLSTLSGAPGATVTISGTDFRDVTGVTLGNVATASFTVVSPTTIHAVVPAAGGPAYGRWRVLSASGTGVSDVVYTVTG